MHQNDDRPADGAKRGFYVVFFWGAFFIDLALSRFRWKLYRPILFGLAVMITSALFFIYSWLQSRL